MYIHDLGRNLQNFVCISDFLVHPTLNENYRRRKAKFWEDSKCQKDKTQFESKRHKSDDKTQFERNDKSDYYQQSFVI